MAESITYSISARAADGPELAKSAILSVEAYDVINATIEKSPAENNINVQPGDAGDVVLLFITSDTYTGITYKVDAGETAITLDKPQLFLGSQVALLGTTCNILKFTNAGDASANVRILVGRSAE